MCAQILVAMLPLNAGVFDTRAMALQRVWCSAAWV
jgi:hypothetical protein